MTAPALTILYARSHSIGGLLICFREPFGRWSHCGILTELGSVLEARAFHGVVETPLVEFIARYPNPTQRQEANVDCPDPFAAIAWARSQMGSGYDYRAIFGLAVREQTGVRSRWHCSELVEAALAVGGRQRFRDPPAAITPNLSYMVR